MSRLLASRRRVFFAALGLLLVLDVGRSILGRLGYAHPTATWQPDPAVYADLTWPPGADLAADVPLGPRVYAQPSPCRRVPRRRRRASRAGERCSPPRGASPVTGPMGGRAWSRKTRRATRSCPAI